MRISLEIAENAPDVLRAADIIDVHNVEDDKFGPQLWGQHSVARCVAPGQPAHEVRVVTIEVRSADEVERAQAAVERAKGREAMPV